MDICGINGEMHMLLNEYIPNYVVFDLETTGISCSNDKVVEISAIKVNNHKVVSKFTTLVNPECPIPYNASRINGITDDMVKDAPVFKTVLNDFLVYIEQYVLVGHNIHAFDMKFIYRDCKQFFGKIPENDYIDTLKMARKCLPQLGHHKLTDLADYYGIPTKGAHRALNDCYMNQKVYEYLGKETSKNNLVVKKCPKFGGIMKKRNSIYGMFWGCGNYPDCRYTENL